MIIGMLISWSGFTRFTLLKEKPSKKIYVVWREIDKFKRQQDQIMCGLRYGLRLGKPLKIPKKQEWAMEKPKSENARQLRGIYFIDQDDHEYQETMKNARKKLETRMAPAMPCKRKDTESFWQRKQKSSSGQRMGRSSKRSQPGNWRKYEARKSSLWRHKETKGKSTSLHGWTSVTSARSTSTSQGMFGRAISSAEILLCLKQLYIDDDVFFQKGLARTTCS